MTYILYLRVVGDQSLKQKYVERIQHRSLRDSGFDLIVPKHISRMYIEGDVPITLDHKVQANLVQVNDKDEEVSSPFYLYPRSSISKTVFRMANSVGIIDKDYRGNLIAKIDIHGGIAGQNYQIEQDTRMFQICTPTLEPIKNVVLVDNLDETERGSGGFGSTGGVGKFSSLETL